MKNQILQSFLAVCAGAVIFQSCQQEDTIPPVIHSVSVNDTIGQDFAVMPGDSLAIRFTIADD